MALRLHRFDGAPRTVRRVEAADYAVLADLLADARDHADEWSVDFDPRWRSLLLLSHTSDPDSGAAAYSEVVIGDGSATASRQDVQVEITVTPSDEGLSIAGAPAPSAHGVRRACRSGPTRGHPVLNATFDVRIDGEASFGDLHAASQQAATRALAAAGTAPTRLDGIGNGEVPTFPELETSIAEVVLNLEELCDWPVAEASETDRKQLGAFLAYQLSLIYGHSLDERMRRVPGSPAAPLREFLGTVTDELLGYAAERGEAGAMVSGLIETWTTAWR